MSLIDSSAGFDRVSCAERLVIAEAVTGSSLLLSVCSGLPCAHVSCPGPAGTEILPRHGGVTPGACRRGPLKSAVRSHTVSPVRRCSRTACGRPAVATLTYVYADSTAVLGPLATYAEPHCYDLCAEHSGRLPPRAAGRSFASPTARPLPGPAVTISKPSPTLYGKRPGRRSVWPSPAADVRSIRSGPGAAGTCGCCAHRKPEPVSCQDPDVSCPGPDVQAGTCCACAACRSTTAGAELDAAVAGRRNLGWFPWPFPTYG